MIHQDINQTRNGKQEVSITRKKMEKSHACQNMDAMTYDDADADDNDNGDDKGQEPISLGSDTSQE